jgi:hypothetical protein
MIDNLAGIVAELSDEDKTALLCAVRYLAALPGTEYDEDRLTRALVYARGGSRADFDETGEPSLFRESRLGRSG